jgi:hypothetical protein
MQLAILDAGELFSMTIWKNDTGYVCSMQTHAGAQWRSETRKTASEAVAALFAGAVPPCPVPR